MRIGNWLSGVLLPNAYMMKEAYLVSIVKYKAINERGLASVGDGSLTSGILFLTVITESQQW